MKIIMGSVAKGFTLKQAVKKHLESLGHEIIDTGCPDADTFYKFPAAGERVAKALNDNIANIAINCCGSGTGASILANKYKGVCAVSCESVKTAELAKIVNDANCLCMGEGVVSEELGSEMAEAFINAKFQDMDGVPQKVLDFWKEARDEAYSKGTIAQEREMETMLVN